MIFHLQPPYEFEPLKSWFRENWKELPYTLDTETKYYMDLRNTVKTNVLAIDSVLLDDSKQMEMLSNIYEDLKISEGWNKPMEKLEQSNRI